MTLDELCVYAAQIGLKGVDLLEPEDFETPKKHGLICTMGYVAAGTIPDALNVVANHDKIEAGLRLNIPLAAKAGVPNVITFSGNRHGMSDEEGAKNVILGLNRVKKIAEDNNVVLCLELLNSKVNHKDYMADHTAWGVAVMKEVNSPHVKLLYDIYHMQIMEGDLIATIQANIRMDWPLSHRRCARTPRAERYPGGAMGWRNARDRGKLVLKDMLRMSSSPPAIRAPLFCRPLTFAMYKRSFAVSSENYWRILCASWPFFSSCASPGSAWPHRRRAFTALP